MDLLVKDIIKIWNNGAASLVAGKEGIMRKVEVFDMMEQPNIKPWLKRASDFDNQQDTLYEMIKKRLLQLIRE